LLITGKEINIPTEQVFDGAENNCAFYKWCLNWNQFPSDPDQLETTQSDVTSFRKFSSLQLRLLGEGSRQYVELFWLKPAQTTGDHTEAKWPKFSNYSKKLLLYADDGQYIPFNLILTPPLANTLQMSRLQWKFHREHSKLFQVPGRFLKRPRPAFVGVIQATTVPNESPALRARRGSC
jgi:hypothetical protein